MNLFTQFAKPLNKVRGSYIGYSLFLTSKKFIDKHFSPLFLTLITTNKKIRKDKKKSSNYHHGPSSLIIPLRPIYVVLPLSSISSLRTLPSPITSFSRHRQRLPAWCSLALDAAPDPLALDAASGLPILDATRDRLLSVSLATLTSSSGSGGATGGRWLLARASSLMQDGLCGLVTPSSPRCQQQEPADTRPKSV